MPTTASSHIDRSLIEMILSPVAADGSPKLYSADEVFGYESADVEAAQLLCLQQRFGELASSVAALGKVAAENHISQINSLDEAVPLLFPHTVYKSYPLSLIDNGRFQQLNDWLQELTAHDLSGYDLSGCQSIEEWLSTVEANTPLRLMTSGGTSGKISLLPRTVKDDDYLLYGYFNCYTPFKDEPGITDFFGDDMYYVLPFAHTSRHSTGVLLRAIERGFGDREGHVYHLGGRMSTDKLWLTGRLKKAQGEGTVEQLKKTKAWKRLSTVQDNVEDEPRSLESLFKDVVTELNGKKVVMIMGLIYFRDMVDAAEKHGLDINFSPESWHYLGGGIKPQMGHKWGVSEEERDKIFDVVDGEFRVMYGFSEILDATVRLCPHDHYHFPPWVIPYVLDPETGAPFPRGGTYTGRFAAIDLRADSYWGGFMSGDELTMTSGEDCPCGRKGPYFHESVIRYTEKNGGDDKITCQRTAAAVAEMAEFMRGATS
jgi:hypothetical protein